MSGTRPVSHSRPAGLTNRRLAGLTAAATGIALLATSGALAGCGGSKRASTVTTATSPTSATATTSGTTAPTSTSPGQGASSGAASRETAPGVVRASQGGVSASLHASTHHPRAGAAWPIAFAVTRQGRAATAEVAYEYLFGGQVVAHRSHYRFTGHFHDLFRWPATAVGYPLTFRAVITSGATTLNLDYPVQVVR